MQFPYRCAALASTLTLLACGVPEPQPAPHYSPKGLGFSYEGTAPVNDEYLGSVLDYYMDYWMVTRAAWNAGPHDLAGMENRIVFDCTFPCRGSPNGLCAGTVDGGVQVAYYRLRRSVYRPTGWERKRNPRTEQDMYALSNNDYWLRQENRFFWCEDAELPMPAQLHEWDHLRFNPHDPAQSDLVLPLSHTFNAIGDIVTLDSDGS